MNPGRCLLFSFALSVILLMNATVVHAQRKTFLRMYSLAGNKFQKGYFAGTSDSSIFIYRNGDTTEVPVVNIGSIKTKRSIGHNMWVSALVGTVTFSIFGAAGGEEKNEDYDIGNIFDPAITYTPAEGALTGAVAGSIIGAATGAIISAVSKHTTFKINGSLDEWREQKRMIDLLPAGK